MKPDAKRLLPIWRRCVSSTPALLSVPFISLAFSMVGSFGDYKLVRRGRDEPI